MSESRLLLRSNGSRPKYDRQKSLFELLFVHAAFGSDALLATAFAAIVYQMPDYFALTDTDFPVLTLWTRAPCGAARTPYAYGRASVATPSGSAEEKEQTAPDTPVSAPLPRLRVLAGLKVVLEPPD